MALSNCIICNSHTFKSLYSNLSIVKCECGHVFYNGNITNEKIENIYTENYFKGEEYSNYIADQKIFEKNFKPRLQSILKHYNNGELLEIGSAYGFFLNLAKAYFNVTGYEICKEACTFAKNEFGISISNQNYISDSVSLNKYDVVVMFDCIEHLLHPEKYIEKISKELKVGGLLTITTGDISKLVPKYRKSKWRLIHPPSHIHYFNKKGISNLLEKYGFRIVSIKYPGIYRSINQIVSSIFKLKKPLSLIPFDLYLNTFDIMEVKAERI